MRALEPRLFSYIWRYSKADQFRICAVVLASLRACIAPADSASDHRTHGQDSKTPSAERPSPAATGRTVPRTGLSEHTRDRLAAQLRAMYDTVAHQPVPDRFAELIAKLDSSDRTKI